MSWRRSVQLAVKALKKDELSLQKELRDVRNKINELEQLSKAAAANGSAPARKSARSNRLSPKGRAAISLAAKKRWARYRSQKRKPAPAKR